MKLKARGLVRLILRLSLTLCLGIFSVSAVHAAWKKHSGMGIGQSRDFYQDLDSDSGVSVPKAYIAAPTAANLRDFLISIGVMEAAPAIVAAASGGILFVPNNDGNVVFSDRDNVVFQSRN